MQNTLELEVFPISKKYVFSKMKPQAGYMYFTLQRVSPLIAQLFLYPYLQQESIQQPTKLSKTVVIS